MRGRRKVLAVSALLLICLGVITSCIGFQAGNPPPSQGPEAYDAKVTEGARLYVEYGCVQCHGLGGRGREMVPDSGPSLTSAAFRKTFPKEARYDEALVNQIRNGTIVEEGGTASMPAWNGILSEEQLRSLVAYIRAGLPDLGVPISPAKTGQEVYEAFACVKCHGSPGTAGRPNVAVQSPEHRTIPAIGGPNFQQRFSSRDEVRKTILNGRLVEGGRPGVVYMPGWGKIGTANQMEAVVEYIWNYGNPTK